MRKVVREKKGIDIEIEKGTRDGQEIVFPRESEQSPGTIPGDLIVKLIQRKHNFFNKRIDDDLYANIGLKHVITCTIKSVFWKFLKNIKFLIIGLYISYIRLFLSPKGRQSNIIFFTFFSWKCLKFKYFKTFSYRSSDKLGLLLFISSKIPADISPRV